MSRGESGCDGHQEAIRKAGLKPVTKKEVLEMAPEMFKGTARSSLKRPITRGRGKG